MLVPVTALYAALLGFVMLVLFYGVGQARVDSKVSLGDSTPKPLLEASRRYMNFVETVPFILVMMALNELNGVAKPWLHGLGIALLVARVVHPFGVDADVMSKLPRLVGAGGTFLVAIAAILMALWQVLRG